MSTTEIRQRISDYHLFLVLASAVSNHRDRPEEFCAILTSVPEFLRTASGRDIRERGKELASLLSRAVQLHDKVLPRKKTAREIARDFRSLVAAEPDIWRFGIQSGWLSERFDTSRLPQAEDLPWHARVGIGVHAGRVGVEEVSLLEDAFFLLVRARESHEAMMRYARTCGLEASPHEKPNCYNTLNSLKSSVCTYSRLGVLTAVAFVEAFVNSVGWNEAVIRSSLSEQEKSELKGIRKGGGYTKLKDKLERMPKLIRADRATPIVLSDAKQTREPFITFLREIKEVRDASVHYAPGKAPILHPPQEWLRLVEEGVRNAIAVAREFWSACYPDRQQPRYLAELYYDGLLQQALDRLSAAEDVATTLGRLSYSGQGV